MPPLQNASIELGVNTAAEREEEDGADTAAARRRTAATLLQGACDLSRPVVAGALQPGDQLHAVQFHLKVGAQRLRLAPPAPPSWRNRQHPRARSDQTIITLHHPTLLSTC